MQQSQPLTPRKDTSLSQPPMEPQSVSTTQPLEAMFLAQLAQPYWFFRIFHKSFCLKFGCQSHCLCHLHLTTTCEELPEYRAGGTSCSLGHQTFPQGLYGYKRLGYSNPEKLWVGVPFTVVTSCTQSSKPSKA